MVAGFGEQLVPEEMMSGSARVEIAIEEWIADIRDRLCYCADQVHRCERIARQFVTESKIETIEEVRPLVVSKWLQSRAVRGAGRKTCLNNLCCLRSFCDWAVSVERITANPLRGLKLPRVPPTRGSDPFTLDEVRRLVCSVLRQCRSPDARERKYAPARAAWYLFLARTGLRACEARAQTWRDIDLEAATMVVTRPKMGVHAILPLDREAVATLRRWRRRCETNDLVFPNPPSHHSLGVDMARAGIEPKPGEWHRLRKCAITERAARGATVRVMQAFARHASPITTQRSYDFLRLAELREASEMMPRIVTPRPTADFGRSEMR